jgi:hypothetical protein
MGGYFDRISQQYIVCSVTPAIVYLSTPILKKSNSSIPMRRAPL